ncbi:MAG: hypothetical protein LBL08_02890 [Candidatus Nomurabacteria bacterium]|nr:hypothetical protein [Candidatus Nomurabacteria bacterium]
MEDSKQKRLTLTRIIIGAVVLAVLVLLIQTIRTMEQNYKSETYIRESRLENEIQEIENENLALEREYYKSDEFLELSARKANKALPGEHLVILPETDDSEKVNTGVAAKPKDERSNLEKWLEFLLGKRAE